jgi:hypothetical protein
MSRLCLRLSHSNAHGRLLLLWVYKPSVHADNWGGGTTPDYIVRYFSSY